MKKRMNRRSLLAASGASGLTLVLGGTDAFATAGTKLPRAEAEAGGLDPAGVLAFVEAAEKKKLGLHSLMFLRHGKVLAEGWWAPYGPQHPHMLYSLSKSFTSTAVGLAVSEGKLTLDDKVLSFFEAERPLKPDANLTAMQVRHLLMMGTGHDKDTTGAVLGASDGDWVKAFLALPVEHAPGSKFVYNTGATYMLSAIVQKVTGKTVLDYLRPRLFEPLGIANPTWETCPKGRSTGGFGLSITTEDIAKFGQLYLQKGVWEGKQLVPASWVAEATQKHISNGDPAQKSDWSQGYGYQFWRCQNGAFRGDGAFCQFCIVLPERDAVVAITAGSGNYQGVVDLVWEHLLPAYREGAPSSPTLVSRLKSLALVAQKGAGTSPVAATVIGKTYRFLPNKVGIEWLRLTNANLVLKTAQGEQTLSFSASGWKRGTATFEGYLSKKVTTHGAWTAPDTLALTVCAYETPFIHTLTCQFAGESVTLTQKTNVSFGSTDAVVVRGSAV